MRIFDFFRNAFKSSTLHTTPVPEGVINHEHRGEEPWENWVDRWTTRGHAKWYFMTQNDYGSYDLHSKIAGYGGQTLTPQYQPFDKALGFLISKETEAMRKYRGYPGLKIQELKDYINDNAFDRGHVFKYLQENPVALENWLEKNHSGYKAQTAEQVLHGRIAKEIKKVVDAGKAPVYTPDDLRKYLKANRFSKEHVFSMIKKDPTLLDRYIAVAYQGKPAPAPANVSPQPNRA